MRPLKIVVAGLIERQGRFLVACRPPGTHLAGHWEFPGGKMEAGESPEQCLARELMEELALPVTVGAVFMNVFHAYPEFDLLMLVYRATDGGAEPQPLHATELRWLTPDEMSRLRFPPADDPIVERLRIGAS